MKNQIKDYVGAVVIGRNEGQRLIACLDSLRGKVDVIVYVDSCSSDNSVEEARKRGIDVISLDLSVPFTAARARNAGANKLLTEHPELEYLQFVDGDCEVLPEWIETARNFLSRNPEYAVVCGRRRERFPDRSVYNQLCDMEWNTPVGDALACGGDAMFRVSVFQEVGGYDPTLIAGEEPEFCYRIRQQGWKIRRIDADMTLHDADITHFRQWWQRNVRGGYAYARGALLHGKESEHYCVAQSARVWFWGAFIPLALLSASVVEPWLGLTALIYPAQVVRIALRMGYKQKKNWSYAFFVMLGKFPELQGQAKCFLDQMTRSKSIIIEYK